MRQTKLKNLFQIFGGLMFFCVLMFLGCKKDLNQPPIGLVDASKIANKNGVDGLLIGAYSWLDGISNYSSWYGAASNWVFGSICGSEAYKGSDLVDQKEIITPLELFTANSANQGVADKWKAAYSGVARSNEVLRILRIATGINEADYRRIEAEARFLRGFYHFEAIKIFGHVPYVDETVTYENLNFRLPNDTLIWGAIETDLRFAMENLPEKMEAKGRANKYAAMAFLAKAMVFQGLNNPSKFSEAKPLFDILINQGVTAEGIPYGLLNNFHDNFNPATKNSMESVFAAQSSVNDGAFDGTNGNYGDILNFPFGGGPAGCCGFFQPSQYLVNHFKTDSQTGLPDLDHFNEVPVKNDYGISSSESFSPYNGTLDPRLDWTVGRRGIPYLDWGPHPGEDWIKPPFDFGPYTPLKNVFSKFQQEHFVDATTWGSGGLGTTAINVNLMRFADLLLLAAEVEIELNHLDKAREYINRVRERASNQAGWVRMNDGSPAANYQIGLYEQPFPNQDYARKVVRYERMLELAMEGHRFFDLVRWGIATKEINDYINVEKNLFKHHLRDAHFIENRNEYFPIPQKQIDLSAGPDGIPKMKQNPGY